MLWDVDHTLLSAGGLSREIYAEVFQEVTGRRQERHPPMAGRTDRAIIADTLRLHDITPTTELTTVFAGLLAEAFTVRQDEIKARGEELPGARAALDALGARPDTVQSLLTGNMRPIAIRKMAAFGLDSFVDLEVGAYGFDAAERHPLVGKARERATRKYGEPFDAATTVLVGDTPHDVTAGQRGGARVVAVATGASDAAALKAAGAELVLPDLADTAAVVRAVLGPPGRTSVTVTPA